MPNGTNLVRITDEHFGEKIIDLSDLEVHEEEKGNWVALVRGVAAWLSKGGHAIGGFDGMVSSNIPSGSGLSSSAAFEVLVGNVFKGLFGLDISPLEIAKAGQFAENVYFGKPCGLMDQIASSYGGLIMIDFEDIGAPVVKQIRTDLSAFALCVVDTGGSHADLTPDYAAILGEMKTIATSFGKQFLREVPPNDFYSKIGSLRHMGDRSVLRAIHFFEENERVKKQADAMENGDMPAFLDCVNQSGRSSIGYLQNVYNPLSPGEQGLGLALAISERTLGGRGAQRINGGGFAGTILAFVPNQLKDVYRANMCAVFGQGCCHFLSIRQKGGMEVGGIG